jgi:hypothetical protein
MFAIYIYIYIYIYIFQHKLKHASNGKLNNVFVYIQNSEKTLYELQLLKNVTHIILLIDSFGMIKIVFVFKLISK